VDQWLTTVTKSLVPFSKCNTSQNSTSQKVSHKELLERKSKNFRSHSLAPFSLSFSAKGKQKQKPQKNKKLTAD
jgi:hypothetical protein